MVRENIGMDPEGEYEVSPREPDVVPSPDEIFDGGSILRNVGGGDEEIEGRLHQYGAENKTGRVMTPQEAAVLRKKNLNEGSDWREQA